MWKEVANTYKGRAGFGRPTYLAFENVVEGDFPIQGLVEIIAVHADDALATAECDEAIFGETTVADEQPSRPSGLLFDLAVKGMKRCDSYGLAVPLGFHEVGRGRFRCRTESCRRSARLSNGRVLAVPNRRR